VVSGIQDEARNLFKAGAGGKKIVLFAINLEHVISVSPSS